MRVNKRALLDRTCHLLPLTFRPALDNHDVRALVVTSTISLGRLAPRADRNTPFAGSPFATTMRVIDRVHGNATNRRPDTAPTHRAGLADLAQAMLFVA